MKRVVVAEIEALRRVTTIARSMSKGKREGRDKERQITRIQEEVDFLWMCTKMKDSDDCGRCDGRGKTK